MSQAMNDLMTASVEEMIANNAAGAETVAEVAGELSENILKPWKQYMEWADEYLEAERTLPDA